MATFPNWNGHNALRRRLIQIGFLGVFVLLPCFDLFRFDFGAGRLHFFGREIWLDEWALLWLALMLAMWLIGALSLLFGRVYCAYACPQMVFTELAHDLDALGKRLTRGLDRKLRDRVARAISLTLLGVLAVLASVVFLGYFAPLGEVFGRLARLDVGLWLGLVGATTALVTFLDFAFVRERFCRSACPYGLLQGLLEDGRSLHVAFDESTGPCIECKACVRVCPMEIDIRQGAFQIECTRCGTCIDACSHVLGKLKPARPSLLAFRLPGMSLRSLDAKRVLVAFATLGFAVAFGLALMRRDLLAFQLSPVYTEAAAAPTVAESRFLLRAANRGNDPVALSVRPEGLPHEAEVLGLEDPTVPAGTERRFELVVRVPIAEVSSTVTPFTWIVEGGGEEQRFAAALLAHRKRDAT
ncbi:MAG: 4Fe-4S dicluster domain-containing protein [Thermoanaerobaculia bacterium]